MGITSLTGRGAVGITSLQVDAVCTIVPHQQVVRDYYSSPLCWHAGAERCLVI